jgi:outer membrane protein insertion porin family
MTLPRHGLPLAKSADMMAFIRGGLLAVAGLLCLSSPIQPQADAEERPEVERLTLQGVNSVDKDELHQSIATEASRCRSLIFKPICWFSKSRLFFERQFLDREELKRDVLRIRVFYWKRGFRDAQVDTVVARRSRGKVAVTFRIAEGAPTVVTNIDVTQNGNVLSDRDISRRIALSVGAPLNLLRLDTTKVRLEQRLWEKGYADAIVDTSITLSADERSARVSIAIDPRWRTTVDSIHVHGNDRISVRTIRRSLTFREGDLFRRSDVLRSQRNLYESNLFKKASVESSEEQSSADSTKIVDVNVQESPLREIRTSVGFNTEDFVQVEGRFTHYNFFGGARRFTIQLAVGNLFAESLNNRFIFPDVFSVPTSERGRYFAPTYTASVELRQPWFGSAKNSLALSGFTHRRSAPGIYIDRGYGSSATFTRELTLRAPASLNYRFEVTTVDAGDVYFCVNFGVCDRATLDALRGHQRLSPLALTASMDRTDDPLGPRRGFRVRFDTEHASQLTSSDYRYNRTGADGAGFFQIRKRGVLAGRLRAGWVDGLSSTGRAVGGGVPGDVLHPRKRFYSGGSQSVRGFRENQLGPRVLTISERKLRTAFLRTPTDSTPACPEPTPIEQCDPNFAAFRDRDFEPRPLGGNMVYEASAELRFPVWEQLSGAVFVDMGFVSQKTDPTLPGSKSAITPGFGARYRSPVGPIRVDLGVNPAKREDLPVITETFVNGERTLTRLQQRRAYSVARSGLSGILDRLVLHLSIGEAF